MEPYNEEKLLEEIKNMNRLLEFHKAQEQHWRERASYWKARAEMAESK